MSTTQATTEGGRKDGESIERKDTERNRIMKKIKSNIKKQLTIISKHKNLRNKKWYLIIQRINLKKTQINPLKVY